MKLGVIVLAAVVGGAGIAEAQKPAPAARPAPTSKRKVILNGVDLENVEVPAQSFVNCEVRFDAQGNIHILAPGFQVKTLPAGTTAPAPAPAPTPPAAAPAGPLTRQYFVAVEENARGLTRWDVALHINGQRITLIRASAGATAFEISRWLRPGTNSIRLVAARSPEGGGSTSAQHYLQIVAGEGAVDKDGQVVIQTHLMLYRRSAAETGGYDNTYTFTAR